MINSPQHAETLLDATKTRAPDTTVSEHIAQSLTESCSCFAVFERGTLGRAKCGTHKTAAPNIEDQGFDSSADQCRLATRTPGKPEAYGLLSTCASSSNI